MSKFCTCKKTGYKKCPMHCDMKEEKNDYA